MWLNNAYILKDNTLRAVQPISLKVTRFHCLQVEQLSA